MEFRCFERSADSEAEERALSKVAVRTVCKDIAESSMVGVSKKNVLKLKAGFNLKPAVSQNLIHYIQDQMTQVKLL